MQKIVSIIKKRHKPLCLLKNGILTCHLGVLYFLNTKTNTMRRLSNIPTSFIKKALTCSRLAERTLRLEPRMGIELSNEVVLFSFQGSMYNININSGELIKEFDFERGMNNPLKISKIEGINGFDDCIVYGEYTTNSDKGPVAIYSRPMAEGKWSKIFEFGPNAVKHIHNIVPDKYRNCVYIFTGDSDCESGIWIAKDNFRDVKPLFVGQQKFRGCVAFAISDGLLYATDTPLEQNYIYIIKHENDAWTFKEIAQIGGSCIYGAKVGDRYLFGTSVEPDSNIKGIKALFSYRLGAGVKGWNSEVYVGDAKTGFNVIASFKKDIFPMNICQFGSIMFCDNNYTDDLFAYPLAVKKYEGKLICLK